MISKREAQLSAVQDCDYEMPSEWVRTDIKIVSCEFNEKFQEWEVEIRFKFEHGDIILFHCWVDAEGEASCSWGAI